MFHFPAWIFHWERPLKKHSHWDCLSPSHLYTIWESVDTWNSLFLWTLYVLLVSLCWTLCMNLVEDQLKYGNHSMVDYDGIFVSRCNLEWLCYIWCKAGWSFYNFSRHHLWYSQVYCFFHKLGGTGACFLYFTHKTLKLFCLFPWLFRLKVCWSWHLTMARIHLF